VIHVPSLLQPENGQLHRYAEAEDEVIRAEILKMPSPAIKRSCVPKGAGSGAMKRYETRIGRFAGAHKFAIFILLPRRGR